MRSPEEHRLAVDAWRAHAPANDSDIIQYPRQSNPRHSALCADLGALLKWRQLSRPKREPLQTNWKIVPANDNKPEKDDYDGWLPEPEPVLLECIHEIRPRESELMAAVKRVNFQERNGQLEPIAGDFERRAGLITRLGDLEFGTLATEAHGATTKPGNNRTITKWRGHRPVDRFTAAKGPDLDEDAERAHRERLAEWLGCEPGWHMVATPDSRRKAKERAARVRGKPNPPTPPTSMTFAEARAFAGLEPMTEDKRPALPLGSPDIGNIFGSWLIRPKKGKGGSAAFDDDGGYDRQAVAAQLSAQDLAILDKAITSQNFREVGGVLGEKGKVAERKGKAALIAATARLSAVMDRMAA